MDLISNKDKPIQPNPIPPISPRKYDKKVHGKRYSVATRLAIKALQNSGMSAEQVAPLTDAHPKTIVRIWEDKELDDLSPQAVSKVKTGMQGLFYKRGLQGLLSMTPEKYSEASLLQIATTVGIMTEKGRLMDGLSTENIGFRNVTEHIESDRTKIMQRLAELNGDKT